MSKAAPTIHTVDFSQPTKFTAELRRRITRVLGPFCEAFALRLSTELRAPVELTVADSSQLTWAAARAQLPANAIAVALEVQPIERHMLLCIEPALVLQALECLLGGTAAQAARRPPSQRRRLGAHATACWTPCTPSSAPRGARSAAWS